MGWELGYDDNWKRWIGYGVPAYCDHPGCNEEIDRGLAYVCGEEPYGGDKGCGLFFCGKHLILHTFHDGETVEVCPRCDNHKPPYKRPSPEHPDWINHLLTDPSWEEWRKENPEEVEKLKKELKRVEVKEVKA